MNTRYERIMDVKRTASEKHPPMPLCDRAAQFAPFAALTGFEDTVKEEARLTERRIELDEYEIEKLDCKLRELKDSFEKQRVLVTYFVNDKRKLGGKYVTKEGRFCGIDEYNRELVLEDCVIKIEDIIDIEVAL